MKLSTIEKWVLVYHSLRSAFSDKDNATAKEDVTAPAKRPVGPSWRHVHEGILKSCFTVAESTRRNLTFLQVKKVRENLLII